MTDQTPRRRNIGDEENRPYTAGGGYPNEPDQTPRIPDLWWSPRDCLVYADREGAAPRYIRMADTALHPLPADAVKLGDAEGLRAKLAAALRLNPGLPMETLLDEARSVWDHAAEFFAGRAEERQRANTASAERDDLRAQLAEIRTAVRAQPTTSHAFTLAHIHQIVAAAGQKRAAEDVRAALSAAPVAKEEQ